MCEAHMGGRTTPFCNSSADFVHLLVTAQSGRLLKGPQRGALQARQPLTHSLSHKITHSLTLSFPPTHPITLTLTLLTHSHSLSLRALTTLLTQPMNLTHLFTSSQTYPRPHSLARSPTIQQVVRVVVSASESQFLHASWQVSGAAGRQVPAVLQAGEEEGGERGGNKRR